MQTRNPQTEQPYHPPSVRSDDPEEITVTLANWVYTSEPSYLIVRRGSSAWIFEYMVGEERPRILQTGKVRYLTAKEVPNQGRISWSDEYHDHTAISWWVDPFDEPEPAEIRKAARDVVQGRRMPDRWVAGTEGP